MCNGNCNQGRMCDCVPAIDEPGTHTVRSDIANVVLIACGFLGEWVCRPAVIGAVILLALIGVHGYFAWWFA